MREHRRLAVIGCKEKRSVTLYPSIGHPWNLRAEFDDGTVWEVRDTDLFECLVRIREQLEAEGGLICCEGARKDVFPSGMARQMGGARQAYRTAQDRVVNGSKLVDIFAATDCQAVVTVSEQIDSVRRLRND